MRKKRRPHRHLEPRSDTQIVTRVRREDVAAARKWLKARKDPTLHDEDIEAMSPLVLFRRLVAFVGNGA